MIENVKEIETGLGLKEGTLTDAIASDEAIKVEMPKGKFYDTETHVIKTNEDHETFLGNIKSESKIAGVEMAVKEYKRESGLEFEGKTIVKLVEATNAKTLSDAKIKPDEKMKAYKNDIELLQRSNGDLKTKYEAEVKKGEARDTQLTNDKNVLTHMKGEYNMSTDRMLKVFNSEYQQSTENGVSVVMKGGEIMKDENRSPLSLESVVTGFSKEFAKTPEGGGGGGNEGGGGGSSSRAAFDKRMSDAGHNKGGMEYMAQLNKGLDDGSIKL